MARKQRVLGKWKQIGCSIVSVGILSCGAGYRTRHPGYLPFTGPAEVRIEQPKQRAEAFVLEPLTVPESDSLDQTNGSESTNIQTNSVPPLKESHFSASSRPVLTSPKVVQTTPEQLPNQKSLEELDNDFFPDGFSDGLFDEPLMGDNVSLRLFLNYFQTNQVQPGTNIPYQFLPPSVEETEPADDTLSSDQNSNTP